MSVEENLLSWFAVLLFVVGAFASFLRIRNWWVNREFDPLDPIEYNEGEL